MLICESCHNERSNRKALESQSLQWSGYKTTLTLISCPNCSHKAKGLFFQYLNAYELVLELSEAKEKLDNLVIPGFTVSDYHSASDMLNCLQLSKVTADKETLEAVLRYTSELEEILEVD